MGHSTRYRQLTVQQSYVVQLHTEAASEHCIMAGMH